MEKVTEKPPLGVRPAEIAAWQRIRELAAGIERQCDSPNGNILLVELWTGEISAQCAMIRMARKHEHENKTNSVQ